MPEFGNPICLLALEEKPNSFIPIDLNNLGFAISYSPLTLRDIDYLTLTYGVDAIREAIKKSNIVSSRALTGDLIILYEENDQKRKAPIIDKEIFEEYDIMNMLVSYVDDKDFINLLVNKIRTLKVADELKCSLIGALRQGDMHVAFERLEMIGYINERRLYLQMIKYIEKKKNAVRVREKAEKKEE